MLDVGEGYPHRGLSRTAWTLYNVSKAVMMPFRNPSFPMQMNMLSSMTSLEVRGGQIVPSMLRGQWNSQNMSEEIINRTTSQHFERRHWSLSRIRTGADGIMSRSMSE